MIRWRRRRDADDQLPEDVRELDRLLASVRFEPRASLGPELLGRVRQEKPSLPLSRPSFWWPAFGPSFRILVVVGLVAAAGVTWFITAPGEVTVDRCCYDLDGGGETDDGIVVIVRSGGDVNRISVYEDRDASRSFTPADLVRFDRTPTLTIPDLPPDGVVIRQHCCSDYDGEGPDDDGVVVVAVPPDRVTMVAMFERGVRSASPPPAPQ